LTRTGTVVAVDVLAPGIPAVLDAVDLESLRRRRSAKWTAYPADVLPAWVAEMDFPLADPIRERLHAAIDLGDTGYPAPDRCGVREALAEWLAASFGWSPPLDSITLRA